MQCHLDYRGFRVQIVQFLKVMHSCTVNFSNNGLTNAQTSHKAKTLLKWEAISYKDVLLTVHEYAKNLGYTYFDTYSFIPF